MTNKTTWLIEPRDALIARDGRPFSAAVAGARATSLDFPFPSTTTGGARTRAGLSLINNDLNQFPKHLINGVSLSDAVMKIQVRGALLAEIDKDGNIEIGDDGKPHFLVHAPADCLIVKPENEREKIRRYALVPVDDENGAAFGSNLPNDKARLHLLGTRQFVKGKPQSSPRFWRWSEFEKWLDEATTDGVDLQELGHDGVTPEQRTHVKIFDKDNQTKYGSGYASKSNSEGGLFQTRGLEFTRIEETDGRKKLSSAKKLALAIEVETPDDFKGKIQEGIAPLGGERRLVAWRESKNAGFPQCPQSVKNKIVTSKACRLILLTPAIFENGFLPVWRQTVNGISPTIEAVAVSRAQVISGWDFKIRRPKPTRRMCPAGTVLFLKFGNADKSAIENWVDKTWFSCVSDKEQDRFDGFGLAALGSWDGELLKIEDVKNSEETN